MLDSKADKLHTQINLHLDLCYLQVGLLWNYAVIKMFRIKRGHKCDRWKVLLQMSSEIKGN